MRDLTDEEMMYSTKGEEILYEYLDDLLDTLEQLDWELRELDH